LILELRTFIKKVTKNYRLENKIFYWHCSPYATTKLIIDKTDEIILLRYCRMCHKLLLMTTLFFIHISLKTFLRSNFRLLHKIFIKLIQNYSIYDHEMLEILIKMSYLDISALDRKSSA
jgi:hypothetical protein